MKATIRCGQCEKRKRRDQFYAQYQNPGCRVPRCKTCVRGNVTGNRKKKRKKYQRYYRERESTPKRKAQRSEWQRKWREERPGRYRARMAVSNAIRDGRLKRKPCEDCGARRNIQAHHEDYRRPLVVRWLCFKCHRAEHKA